MSKRSGSRSHDGVLATAEAAVLLARRAPPDAWAAYLGGSVPFILGVLYFWSDMSRGVSAHARCAPYSLALVFLFLWMKAGHSIYASRLLDVLTHRDRPWSWRRLGRMAWIQSATQPWGLIAIPMALLLLFPLGWVHGYFQNMTVIGDGDDTDFSRLQRRAWMLAGKDKVAHHLTIWLLSPWTLGLAMLMSFGMAWLWMNILSQQVDAAGVEWFLFGAVMFVFVVWPLSPLGFALVLNLAVLFVLVPELLRILLGWDTLLRLSSIHAVANTTFLAALFCLAYLCLDPLLKAAYVIRCFKGESVRTGQDLLIALEESCQAREDSQ